MTRTRAFHVVPCMLLALAWAAIRPAGAETSTYDDEATFREALSSPYTSEMFDGYPAATVITTQVSGVTFSSPNADLDGYYPIQTFATEGAASAPNVLFGGAVLGSPTPDQIIVLRFSPTITAFGFQLVAQDPTASPMSITIDFNDESSEIFLVGDTDENESTPNFFGALFDRPAFRVTLTSGREFGGEGGFEEFAVDNLIFKSFDSTPPVCRSTPSEGGINGTATEFRPGDSGIDSVELLPGSMNLELSVDEFAPGTGSVSFRLFRNPDAPEGADATGGALVTDRVGLTCTVGATLHEVPAGPLTNEQLCANDGIVFLVSNGNETPAGTSVCSADLPTGDEPALPPGYEPSPADDPSPCQVLTIDSPVIGDTEMIYKKDGPFDSRLRLLYSHYDSMTNTFPPFTDITTSVEPIIDINGDPTRVKGDGSWSPVKIACAIQGAVDCATLPATLNDRDGDGYVLCPAAGSGAPADCNGDIPTIHPGATEICNGLDDDCDAAIDEGLGTVSCGVGACMRTVDACVDGAAQTCVPGAPAAETCNGIDDDCDGVVDNLLFFGGYLPPVNADGSSVFTGRQRTIPFKFRLTDCAGQSVGTATATIDVVPVALYSAGGVVEEVTSSGNANSGNYYRYDASSGQYIYNLSTQSLPRGMVYDVITTIVNDGSRHMVRIAFK